MFFKLFCYVFFLFTRTMNTFVPLRLARRSLKTNWSNCRTLQRLLPRISHSAAETILAHAKVHHGTLATDSQTTSALTDSSSPSSSSSSSFSTSITNSFLSSRTHTCGELRVSDEGARVRLCGWLQFKRLDKFLLLKDSYGVTQLLLKEDVMLDDGALRSGTTENPDVSTGPLARPFARSLAPLTHSLAPYCSLRSRAPLRSFVRSLAHSLTPELVGE